MNAIYARQSLDIKDSISIETQIERAKSILDLNEQDILTYIDKGYSGKNTNRPAYTQVMSDIEAGLINRVIVYRLDRFSRSLLDFSIAWEYMDKHNVEFISVNEKFDTSTPIGKAMVFIIMIFAQLERETIAERVTDNYYDRSKKGSWPGGPAPYGLELTKIFSGGKMTPSLIANTKINIIERIFSEYIEPGVSLGSIAKQLNKEGIQSVKRTTWNNVTLARLLKNPVYVKANADIYAYYKSLGVKIKNQIEEFTGDNGGLLVGKRGRNPSNYRELSQMQFSVGNWQGIIEPDVFIQVQKKLASNKQICNSGKGSYTWLSGLIKCGYCNRSMSIRRYVDSNKREIRYMNCSGRYDKVCDKITNLRVDEVEEYVSKEIDKMLEACSSEDVEIKNEITNDDKILIQKLDDELSNLIECIATGKASKLTIDIINKQIEKIEKQRQELLSKATLPPKKVKLEKIEFYKLDFENRKLVAQSLIDKICINIDDIIIEWKV